MPHLPETTVAEGMRRGCGCDAGPVARHLGVEVVFISRGRRVHFQKFQKYSAVNSAAQGMFSALDSRVS